MAEKEQTGLPNLAPGPPFRVEDCLVLPALNRIECGVETHQIEPRVMQVLLCLAARPNEVLSRQALFDTVWADSVVCEEALTRTISELRRVFRDDTKTPRVIETIRKGGYRLIAPVTPASAPAGTDSPACAPAVPISPAVEPVPVPTEPVVPPVEPAVPSPRNRVRTGARAAILGLAVVALLSLVGARWFGRADRPAPDISEPRPLTSFPGLELFPALSPDGSMVAFAWAGTSPGEDNPLDLYVMKVRNGSPVRLTNLPGAEASPAWSPDGTEIAFSCDSGSGPQICTVAVLGGAIRRLATVESTINGLDWSPDGRTIAYAAGDTSGGIPRVRLLSLDDLVRRDLTSPPQHCLGDLAPALAPDGRRLAFIRINELQERDAWVVSLADGAAHQVDLGGMRVSGVDWLTPGELIVSAATRIDYGLWRVAVESGERTRLSGPGGRIQRLDLARTGRHLAYEKISFARSIRCLDVSREGAVRPRPSPVIASTQRDSEPVVSPDGRSIAFVSDRSGAPEVWIAEADGGNPRQFTDRRAAQMTHPRWSPDGLQLAYSCNADGPLSIYVAPLESRVARRLPPGGPQVLALWSRSGDALYYQVDVAGGWEVWRVHPDGSGGRRIGEASYTIIDETADGQGLFVLKSGEPGIWRLPVDGSARTLVVPGDVCRNWQEAIAAENGFYFLRRGPETSTLGFYDLASARSDSLALLEWYAASLTLSPDRSMLLYDCIGKIENDLMFADVRE